jgi:hypothetical protein
MSALHAFHDQNWGVIYDKMRDSSVCRFEVPKNGGDPFLGHRDASQQAHGPPPLGCFFHSH